MNPPDRRTRKRLATRESISDAATRLFIARGFDHVTVDEIAAAADVGRMTVFNHFRRKEDMFFDREEEARDILIDAVRGRASDVAPLEALRRLAHRLVADGSPYLGFDEDTLRFAATIAASDALKARARAIRDEVALALAEALAASVEQPADDADARLAANLLMATWTVAFTQALAGLDRDGDRQAAQTTFLSLVDKGTRGMVAALAGTPYALLKGRPT